MQVEQVLSNPKHAPFTGDMPFESSLHRSLANGMQKKLPRDGAHGRGKPLTFDGCGLRHEKNYKVVAVSC